MPVALAAPRYPDVRSALSVKVTVSQLPDAVIGSDLYAGAAVRWGRGMMPTYDALTDDDKATVDSAVVLYCASLIAPAMPDIVGQDWANLAVRMQPMDWRKRAVELLGRAQMEIAGIVEAAEATADDMPSLFVRASGGRGG